MTYDPGKMAHMGKLTTYVEGLMADNKPTPKLQRMFDKYKERYPEQGSKMAIHDYYTPNMLLHSASVRDELNCANIVEMLRSTDSHLVKSGLVALAITGATYYPHHYNIACEIAFRKTVRSHAQAEEMLLNGLLALAYEPVMGADKEDFIMAEMTRYFYARAIYFFGRAALKPETKRILGLFDDIKYGGMGVADRTYRSLTRLLDACTYPEGDQTAPKHITKFLAGYPEKALRLKEALQYLIDNCELSFGTKIAAQRALGLVEEALKQ